MLKRTLPGLILSLAFMAAAPAFAVEHHYTFTGQATTTAPPSERYGTPEVITGAISGTFAYDEPSSLPTLGLRERTQSLPDGGSTITVFECCQEVDGGNYGPFTGRDFGLVTWSLAWASGTDYRQYDFFGEGGRIERTLLADGSSTLTIGSSVFQRNRDEQAFSITFFSDSDILYRNNLSAIPLSAVTSIQGEYLGFENEPGKYRNFSFVATVAPAVPEPSTFILALMGLAALPVLRRSR